MLYAILAYHVEQEVAAFTQQEDAALMLDLNEVHERWLQQKRIGPAARLGAGLLRRRLYRSRRRHRRRARLAPRQSDRDV
jgi:hypothetical protein